ncbi:hypothetical protein EST38_g883 [Candolleomyces aberdarensis]|uniref:Glycoside hydrolase family 16 protein n=1 Tax=Candolleomyces aberdarensis TaxID=2316362 RepID=A0A4Q2DZI6_9AGAR|nr:hypothetical protein EST38_g883 [Candolleomyces aberdarensis]
MRLQNVGTAVTFFLLPAATRAATYNLIKQYAGSTFFNDWDFYDHFDDKMNGDVNFVSASVGASARLAYVDSNTNRAIIKVDNTSTVPWNEKRNAVRITSKDSYPIGSLWIADIYHAPYGVSSLKGAYSPVLIKDPKSAGLSPGTQHGLREGAEIDVFEGVNAMPTSQMGLHTTAGCVQRNPNQLTTLVNSTDCAGDNNAGCMLTNTHPSSYGPAFAAAQGGVFITEFAESGISVWFMARKDIPSSLTGASAIDTSTLGTPMGNWPQTGCDIKNFFQSQNLVFTVTLCGDFAGPPNIFNATCTGTCYLDYVIKDPSNYDNAYFDIASVRVFSSNPSATTISPSSTSTSSPSQSSQTSNGLNLASLRAFTSTVFGALLGIAGLELY